MAVQLGEDHCSLVVVGGFDPSLFHPSWFRAEKLLGAGEAEHADVKIVAPQLADWSTEWLHLQVVPNKLVAIAQLGSRAESVRDLVVGILQLLDHTMTTALGINRTMHFSLGDEDSWHRVGDVLAPKHLWQQHFPRRPGMLSVQIEEKKRADGLAGRLVVTVQPSALIPHGALFDVNNEITADGKVGTAFFQRVIRERCAPLFDEAKSMAHSVLEAAQKP